MITAHLPSNTHKDGGTEGVYEKMLGHLLLLILLWRVSGPAQGFPMLKGFSLLQLFINLECNKCYIHKVGMT